jgi:hypothetical protein
MRSTRCCVASTKRQKRPRISWTRRGTPARARPCRLSDCSAWRSAHFFWPARLLTGWPRAAPSPVPRPPWPRSYAETSPSNSARRTAPDPRRPLPLHSTVQRSSGCPPPAPRWPRLPQAAHTRRPLSAPWGGSDSGGPRATGARAAGRGWPGGATARQPSAGRWHRRRHAPGTTPQPPASSGGFCPAGAGQHARPMLAPRRPSHGRPPVPPTTAAVADAPPRRAPPSLRRPGRPRRRGAAAAAAPAVVGSHRYAPRASRRARRGSCRWARLGAQRGHEQARRAPGDAQRAQTPPGDHAHCDPLCRSLGVPPPPTAGLFCATPSQRRPARPPGPPETRPRRGVKRRGGPRHPLALVPTPAGRPTGWPRR